MVQNVHAPKEDKTDDVKDSFYEELERVFDKIPKYRMKIVRRFQCQSRQGKLKLFKLHGLSPRANYTDRATAACRRSSCQLLQIEGATWSA
jgi:hypothetical protein